MRLGLWCGVLALVACDADIDERSLVRVAEQRDAVAGAATGDARGGDAGPELDAAPDATADPGAALDADAGVAPGLDVAEGVDSVADAELGLDAGGEVAPDASADADADADPAQPEGPGNLNEGFIGGACASLGACDYSGAICLGDDEGFPAGHCSQPCDLYCPDQAGAVTTFCVDAGELGLADPGGLCVMRCDYGLSPTGCRAGYQCVPLDRNGDAQTVVYACVPGTDHPFELSACHQALLDRGVGFTPAPDPLDVASNVPGVICSVFEPIRVAGLMHGVSYRYATTSGPVKPIFASCPLALAMAETAALLADQGVTDILHFGVYNCRAIANTTKLSQHGLANAIDINGLRFASGTTLTIKKDWEVGAAFPVTEGGSFLRWVAETLHALLVFTVILTPEYNADHADHLHCDLTPGSDFLK